jgi:hypothetical protein
VNFRDADERIAWDRFVASSLAKGCDTAVAEADNVIWERRKRDGAEPVVNQATDSVDQDGWTVAQTLDRIAESIDYISQTLDRRDR